MNPFTFITGLFKPVTDLIDQFIEDPDERREARLKLQEIQSGSMQSVMDFVTTQVKEQASVIREEMKAGGLAAQWRPITALAFVSIIVYNEFVALIFGLPRTEIVPDLWEVIKIMIGGYVVSRGGEKIVDSWSKTRRQNESV